MFGMGGRLQHIVTRSAVLIFLWWILAGDISSSWVIGLPVIAGAVLLSFFLSAPHLPFSFVLGVFKFIPFFLLLSVRGGIDVARRALSISMPLHPKCFEYKARLSSSSALVFFANSISLLPGTLSVDLGDGLILVHTLDHTRPVVKDLARLEERIAKLFCLSMIPVEANE